MTGGFDPGCRGYACGYIRANPINPIKSRRCGENFSANPGCDHVITPTNHTLGGLESARDCRARRSISSREPRALGVSSPTALF
jgi:hypothetical protein